MLYRILKVLMLPFKQKKKDKFDSQKRINKKLFVSLCIVKKKKLRLDVRKTYGTLKEVIYSCDVLCII